MATYTDNYQLTKPTYAEQADIGVINSNMNKIDEIMHSSQIILADAYDSTQTYAEGDVVMYELLMYKCISPTTGVWDASKWERTTASESGGGGSAELDILGEASGAVASFADGASAELAKCIAEINPTQDLHGYDKPWIGGAGKNLLNANIGQGTQTGVTFTNTNGVIRAQGDPTADIFRIVGYFTPENGVEYILTGCPSGGSHPTYRITLGGYGYDFGEGYTFIGDGQSHTVSCDFKKELTDVDLTFYPMIRLSTEPSGFEPYTNICPISGHSSVTINVSPTNDTSQGVDTTIQLGDTYYSGTLNAVNGELTVTYGYIASYNGETLTGEWLSDRDEYTSGGTPTTGAEVVYELATPITVQLTPQEVNSLLGQNNISADTGDVDIVYVKASAPIQPNPTGTPTATLKKLGIEGTVFELEGGGGGSSGGIVIDSTERAIGTWFGNTLYQRGIILSTPVVLLKNAWTAVTNLYDFVKIVECEAINEDNNEFALYPVGANCDSNNNISLLNLRSVDVEAKYVILKYIKTT